jgi:hypothetical protein
MSAVDGSDPASRRMSKASNSPQTEQKDVQIKFVKNVKSRKLV